MISEAIKLAEDIASKSPVAVQATKKNLVYSLEHTNQEGLDQIVSSLANIYLTSIHVCFSMRLCAGTNLFLLYFSA